MLTIAPARGVLLVVSVTTPATSPAYAVLAVTMQPSAAIDRVLGSRLFESPGIIVISHWVLDVGMCRSP
jgi:hypothetical protein